MLERRRGLDFHHEALGADHGGELRLQDLERHLAVVLEVLGEVHGGHAALAEFALDAVAVGQRGGEAGKRIRHFFTFSFSSSNQLSTSRKSASQRSAVARRAMRNRWSSGEMSNGVEHSGCQIMSFPNGKDLTLAGLEGPPGGTASRHHVPVGVHEEEFATAMRPERRLSPVEDTCHFPPSTVGERPDVHLGPGRSRPTHRPATSRRARARGPIHPSLGRRRAAIGTLSTAGPERGCSAPRCPICRRPAARAMCRPATRDPSLIAPGGSMTTSSACQCRWPAACGASSRRSDVGHRLSVWGPPRALLIVVIEVRRESGPAGSSLIQISSPELVWSPMASRLPSGESAQPALPAGQRGWKLQAGVDGSLRSGRDPPRPFR